MMGCEPGEVLLKTLAAGAAFELILTHTTGIRGVVVRHCAGSTLVDCGAKQEHWCYDAQVVPHPEVKDVESWIKSNEKGETMAKSEKKVAKVKGLLVVRYEATSKKHEAYSNPEKKSFAALAYRTIVAEGAITFDELWSKIYRNVTGATEGKTPKNTVRASLSVMAKQGFIKYVKTREEAKAVAA
jgi:hypothetical protein